MAITLDGTNGITSPTLVTPGVTSNTNLSYTGTLTGGTGVVNIGSGQVYKDASGNVGVGTTPSAWGSPFKAIDIGAYASFSGTTTGAALVLQNAYYNGTSYIYKNSTDNALRYTLGSGSHAWSTAPSGTAGNAITFTQAMTLDASGNLLVGTTGGASKLTVASAGTVASFTASGLASSATVQIQAANGAGYNARLYFECPGVNSGGLTYERANSRLYAYSQTDLSGPYVSPNGTSWTTNSDRRLKTDIQEIAYGLTAVMALEPKSYSYKNNTDKKCLGLIAQDVAGVIPEVVDVPNDADAMMGIEYQSLVTVLIKAIQEQQALISSLTTRLTALENK